MAMVLAGCLRHRMMARIVLVAAAASAGPAAGPEVDFVPLLPRMQTVILRLLMGTTDLWVLERSCPWGYTSALVLAVLLPAYSISGFQEHPEPRLCRFLRLSIVFFRFLPM